MKKLILIVLLLVGGVASGQSVTGTSGLIHIPSARMLEDGQLVIGAAYIPKPYFKRYERRLNPGLNTYVTYAFFPFIEVMFRYTHELNMPVLSPSGEEYFPDRMFTIRGRLLKEKKYLPAIVLGLQDASAIFGNTCLGCSNYSAIYFVGSKNFKTDFGNFDLSIGYAFDYKELKAKDYKGVFGGVSFTPNFYENASFVFEHNSKGYNTGISTIVLSRFNLMLGIWNLDKPTFSFNYLF
ncbi:YjbH domain-containing protein [Flavobacteriaceae bacterium]|nr:YjbH domain-containing protein [Flavobacteriaceae bacterium]MDC1542164.1 YjbH domain-containing protein [Flavobacteriaceae bacterium]